MKNKTTFKNPLLTLLKYTAKTVDEIRAYKPCVYQEDNLKRMNLSKNFRYVSGKRKSPLFVDAYNYNNQGYAYVLKSFDTSYYYIDKDFDPVLSEKNVTSVKDLSEVILSAPRSVLKYLSLATIQKIHDDTYVEMTTSPNADTETFSQFDVIEKFMAKNQLFQSLTEAQPQKIADVSVSA